MNCLEFHRLKLADPRRLPVEAQAHAEGCEACAAFAHDVDETERGLQRALAIPVPDGLADRIVLRVAGGRRRLLAPAWALAASVVLAVAAGIGYFRYEGVPSDYARLAIEHVVMEPESLTSARNADPAAFQKAIQAFGGSLKEPMEHVRYVRLCPVADGFGWHIVFETPDGLATLFLVLDKTLPQAQAMTASGWSAVAKPARRGYYAIVAASAEATARAERMLLERVKWDA